MRQLVRNILLVEPKYKSKYPPLGLMKISTYHKLKGDRVVFVKGCIPEMQVQSWDRIYISSLFTYYWKETLQTIYYYQASVPSPADIYVGGVMATLLYDDLKSATGATVIPGLLDKPGILDAGDKINIDALTPDYSILNNIGVNFYYKLQDCYIGYATRGCPRRCPFCAVYRIEPEFVHYLPLKRQVQLIQELYGEKRDLILLDNNVLASERFSEIIGDIKSLGFEQGATYSYINKSGRTTIVKRHVDFNQGLDLRLLSEDKVALLSEIAISPLRLAFDDLSYKEMYENKVRLIAKYGINNLSNYVLYNYRDHPDELYERLKININLNEELGLQIFSFPMRYIDLYSKDRLTSTNGNVGKYWNKKYLRAIRCILNRTRGLVGTRRGYFEAAFGHNLDEYHKILLMPEAYILNRVQHEKDGSTELWWSQVCSLSGWERDIFMDIICNHRIYTVNYSELPRKVKDTLSHYLEHNNRKKNKHNDGRLLQSSLSSHFLK
ncbi:MAG: cobalamin-binding domain-containing protein [Bacillota bacterium]|nr:cobalamin-binding domain-containing protein [Bacillota bacterium]